jgi:cytochrome c oxidase assembly factor CtaG
VDPYRWSWDADALVVIPGMAAAYAIALTRFPAPRWRIVCFGAGCALMLAVQITPLDTLALHYLLVMHLLQNVVLAEWGPLLVVIGLTPVMARELERLPGARALTHPLVALPIWLGVYYAWHVPTLYDAALRHQWTILHLEHATYFFAGCLLWWPVVHGRRSTCSRPSCSAARSACCWPCSPTRCTASTSTSRACGGSRPSSTSRSPA